MELIQIVLLLGAGLAAGFLAGLIGVGGGIIFAPVLFFYFASTGIAPDVIAPLTIGSSLFCTLVAALSGGWFHYRAGAVAPRIALSVGLFSAAAIYLTTRYVTTQPWYSATVFQVAFSVVLLAVVVRMVRSKNGAQAQRQAEQADDPVGPHWTALAGTGTVAGIVSSAVGVGGGIVLVPAYHHLLHLPMHRAAGTSSATIVLISSVGVVTYALLGASADVPATALGYVDFGQALLLAGPALLSARLGVWVSHRSRTRVLRLVFAALAALVAARMLLRAAGVL